MDLILGSGAKPAAPAGGGDLIKDGSAATFAADVIEASRKTPVIVDFWATWCGPCKTLGPALEKVVRELRGAVRMVKIDVDKEQQLAAQLRIQSVPTVYAFVGGRPVDAFTGALPESQIRAFLQRLVQMGGGDAEPSLDEVVAEAKELLAAGDAETAAQAFQQVLAEDPSHAGAMAGLLRSLLALGDAQSVKQMLAQLPPEMLKTADIAAVKTALELQETAAAGAGESAELRRRLATDANDHQARFDLALAYYGAGEPEAAVDELLELFRRDRAWNEDAARKQLVKLFEAFGPTHPLTVSGRRRLSSLLFS
ncbi:MAG: thioredoxin [Magnetospirillum sp.]|nr:thioredoxin [Magnetospirillum sp.]